MLADIQEKILYSLLSCETEDLDFIKSYNGLGSAQRLLIHRQTILENFVNSLKISYPGIWRLLGEPCARGAGLSYAHDLANIPSAGKMAEFGANFPEHLKNFPSTHALTYLPDYARLEWLRSLSYEAPNQAALHPEELAKIDLDALDKYKFIFNSSVFFMKSDFPLAKIQNVVDGESNSAFDLAHEESYICVYRFDNRLLPKLATKEQVLGAQGLEDRSVLNARDSLWTGVTTQLPLVVELGEKYNKVNTAWFDKASWDFLWALSEGKALGEAVSELEIDLEAMFGFIFTRGLVVKMLVESSSARGQRPDVGIS